LKPDVELEVELDIASRKKCRIAHPQKEGEKKKKEFKERNFEIKYCLEVEE